MTESDGNNRGIKTADRVFDVVETLRDLEGGTTREVAEALDVAKSTAHEYLRTMEAREYLYREDGVYYVGLRFLDHGMFAANRYPSEQVVLPSLDQLSSETEELVLFTVEEHGHVVDLYKSPGARALTVGTWVGKRTLMHHLAAGKAILAHLPTDRVTDILDRHGMPAQTEYTITDQEALLAELESVRGRGVAFNEEETTLGVRSIAAPVLVDHRPVGAVAITGPARRLTGDRFRSELPNRLLAATNEIELKLLSE